MFVLSSSPLFPTVGHCRIYRRKWLKLNSKVCDFIIGPRSYFFIVQNCSFFMAISYANVALVWTFNTRRVYNFITKKANIPINLVPFFNGVLFLFCRFLKSGATNEIKKYFSLKKQKIKDYLFTTGKHYTVQLNIG